MSVYTSPISAENWEPPRNGPVYVDVGQWIPAYFIQGMGYDISKSGNSPHFVNYPTVKHVRLLGPDW